MSPHPIGFLPGDSEFGVQSTKCAFLKDGLACRPAALPLKPNRGHGMVFGMVRPERRVVLAGTRVDRQAAEREGREATERGN